MDKIVILAIIGLVVVGLFGYFLDMFFTEWRARIHDKWLERRTKKKGKAEERKRQKEAKKYSKVYVGNPYLEMIVKSYNIIIYGALGAGKTLFANLLCKYLCDKYAQEDKRNRDYNKHMNPDYLKEITALEQKNLLRVYAANITLTDDEGKKTQDLWPYLTQKKRFCERGIIFTDEFGSSLGKDLWFSQDKNSEEVERIVEMSRYARQDCDIKWIGTEQSRDNIFKPIRDRGFTEVKALRTYVGLTLWGKIKKRCIYFCRLLLPGYFSVNWLKTFEKTLFVKDKIILALKLLLPVYFTYRREYYITKTETSSKIKSRHTLYTILVDFYGKEMMFKFNNRHIFKYDTRHHKDAYLKQFDKEGNRIYA